MGLIADVADVGDVLREPDGLRSIEKFSIPCQTLYEKHKKDAVDRGLVWDMLSGRLIEFFSTASRMHYLVDSPRHFFRRYYRRASRVMGQARHFVAFVFFNIQAIKQPPLLYKVFTWDSSRNLSELRLAKVRQEKVMVTT